MTITRVFSIIMVVALLFLMVGVRLFEVELFNDPLNNYFHSDFQKHPVPALNYIHVIAGTSLRYLFNMVISLWLLWYLYKKEMFIKAALWVYLFAFVILITAFIFLLHADSDLLKMALFYVRRFLIHPILLFIMVAGFYFLNEK
ncbi:exosortase F system-associated membrane protein [Nonlabens sp.]|mgnify:CR=1 FL=1|uniref:exosortase F system-associated membrane protein n=1 Tax=Nonlabens sp. TaxID=1888209 RepID=UPI003F69B099